VAGLPDCRIHWRMLADLDRSGCTGNAVGLIS
jgi:hypothetical protein